MRRARIVVTACDVTASTMTASDLTGDVAAGSAAGRWRSTGPHQVVDLGSPRLP